MTALILFVVFGVVGGLIVKSIMESRSSLSGALSAALGIIGSFTAGIILLIFGKSIVGDGPDYVVTLLAAAAGGIILPFIFAIFKR